jgi:hypothetical protein
VADNAALKQRIDEQTRGDVRLEIGDEGRTLRLVDLTTQVGTNSFEVINLKGAAVDLRLVGTTSGDTIESDALLGGLNTTLTRNLAGGAGLTSGEFIITTSDGSDFNFSIPTDSTVAEIVDSINDQTGGAIKASIGNDGVSISLVDKTYQAGSNSANLVVQGAGAEALGLATDPLGNSADRVNGSRLQRRYVAESTLLSSIGGGQGVGAGTIEITGPDGRRTSVTVGSIVFQASIAGFSR